MPDKSPHIPDGAAADRIAALARAPQIDWLKSGLRGIERESLRVTPQGGLATTPHPRALGAALTQPLITTDYSEALLELITDATPDSAVAVEQLDALHRFVYSELGDELLWNQSMPGRLPPDGQIPIAEFGTSHIGRLKHIYRRGLSIRYGRAMQCIAGIHYNFSLDERLWEWLRQEQKSTASARDFQSESYIALIRNFRRTSWLLMMLFGASPAVDRQFLRQRPHTLETLDAETLYLPYATSLRMSDLGYQNATGQADLMPNYESLGSYVASLSRAVSQPYPPYAAIGTHRDGEWVQINTNVLQIENEFYSSIRPKRVTRPGERPLHALATRGVQYVEVRCLDIDPFAPAGIALETTRFMDAFLLYLALESSPDLTPDAHAEAGRNFAATVREGRRPGLELQRNGQPVALLQWADELLDKIAPVAALLDRARASESHVAAVEAQRAKIRDLALTPSARILQGLRNSGKSYAGYALELSLEHAAYYRQRPLPAAEHQKYAALAQHSIEQQAELEANQVGDFDTFIATYNALTVEAPGA